MLRHHWLAAFIPQCKKSRFPQTKLIWNCEKCSRLSTETVMSFTVDEAPIFKTALLIIADYNGTRL